MDKYEPSAFLVRIGENIKRIRKYLGIKQEYIAKEIGITQSEHSKYESGKIDFPVSVVDKISKVCKMPVESIVTGDKTPCEYAAEFAKTIKPDISIKPEKLVSPQSLAFNEFMLKKENLEKTKILESAVILAETDYVKDRSEKIQLINRIKEHVSAEQERANNEFQKKLDEYWEYLLNS